MAELPPLLLEMGHDPAAFLAGHGLVPADLAPGRFLPLDMLLRLADDAAQQTRQPWLGLLAGLRFRFAIHGQLGELMQAAPTLGQALLDFVSWQPGYSSGAIVYLRNSGGRVALGHGSYGHSLEGSRQICLLVGGAGVRIISLLTGGEVEAEELHIACAPPPTAAPLALPSGFCPIRFNQEQTCVLLDATALAMPLPTSDPARHRQLREQMDIASGLHTASIAARVRHRLRPLLQSGQPLMAATAAQLRMHPRTLRRRLAAEGQSFERIRDDVRFVMARELLALTELPVGDVAATLAFAAPGNFTEAFHRWSGTTPLAWRAAHRVDPASSRFAQ